MLVALEKASLHYVNLLRLLKVCPTFILQPVHSLKWHQGITWYKSGTLIGCLPLCKETSEWWQHTPSIAFRHLPPNSARFSYATEGALFISVQLSIDAVSALQTVRVLVKLQALVYDIFPSTTAIFSYAIGSRKLSANKQFFVGAQTVVGLLQTPWIKQGTSFIAANKVYTSTNKTTIVWIETELFMPGVDASHVYMCALVLGCFYSHISTGTFWRALITSLDSCAEIKSTPSVA